MSNSFYDTLQQHFPGALPLDDYLQQTSKALKSYNFVDQNTMGMVAMCRDEIAEPVLHGVIKHWGKTFNCCSLAGFILMGRTGLAAAIAHLPTYDGIGRFVFYAMPHIAISRYGEIGKVCREGMEQETHACGSLEAISMELSAGLLNIQTDLQDIEQSIIRQKLLSGLRYGDQPNLVDITKLASQVIIKDLDKLVSPLDINQFHYGIMTGILIHGPADTNWIYPMDCYVVGSSFPNNKVVFDMFNNLK